MRNNLVGLLIGLAVSIIVVGSVMMPALNDATATHKTFDNSDFGYQMKVLEVGDTWTYTDSAWYYGDEEITSEIPSTISVLATDNVIVRSNNLARGIAYSSNNSISGEVVEVDSSNALLMNGATSLSFESGFGAVNDGDYIIKTYDDSAYVNGGTDLWVSGYTALASVSTSQLFVHIEGTLDDGFTVSVDNCKNSTVTDIVVGDYTVNYEEVDGYEDLYLITSIEFDVTGTYSEESVTSTFVYSTFVMPEEVTAELSAHMSDSEIVLMNVIPVMVILGIFMFAAYAVTKRD